MSSSGPSPSRIPFNPFEALESMTDHDLLIRLSTLMEALINDMRSIREERRRDDEAKAKADAKFDERLRRLESFSWKAAAVIAAMAMAGEFLMHNLGDILSRGSH